MPDESQDQEVLDPLEMFPPMWRAPVQGLAYLGQLTDEFSFCGHTYVIRTLKAIEKMAIGTVIQPWRNTLYEDLAWKVAHIGMSLVSIDGEEGFCPPSTRNIEDFVRGRLAFISDQQSGWEDPTINVVWARVQKLNEVSARAIVDLDFLLQSDQPTSPPWPDTLIDSERLDDEIASDFQP